MFGNLSDYSLSEYGNMIADKTRMDPYAYALKAAITPDSVVLDIGAATGIHALLACKFGARQVYAIEPCIQLSRRECQGVDIAGDHLPGPGQCRRDCHDSGAATEVEHALVADPLRFIQDVPGQHLPRRPTEEPVEGVIHDLLYLVCRKCALGVVLVHQQELDFRYVG